MKKVSQEVKILYTNWKGETALRRIIPKNILFTSTKWHKETHWCLMALDLDKKEERTFALKYIKSWFI